MPMRAYAQTALAIRSGAEGRAGQGVSRVRLYGVSDTDEEGEESWKVNT